MKWINIKDELPPDRRAVLLCIEVVYAPGFMYTSGALSNGRWMLNESHDLLDTDCYEYDDGYDDDITHWMPLPPPPSSSNSEYAECPCCGEPWNIREHDSCSCGAFYKMSNGNIIVCGRNDMSWGYTPGRATPRPVHHLTANIRH